MTYRIEHSPLWVPANSLNEGFEAGYNYFVEKIDRFGGPLLQELGLDASVIKAVCITPGNQNGGGDVPVASPNAPQPDAKPFPYMFMIPFVVAPCVCDDQAVFTQHPGTPSSREASGSFVSMITDMFTSFQIMLAMMPDQPGHASVSIQVNQAEPLYEGKRYLLVCRVDKMGRRIIFSSCDIIEADETDAARDGQQQLPPLDTIDALRAAIAQCPAVANAKHTKAVLSKIEAKKA